MANIGQFLFFNDESTETVSNSYGNPNDATSMTIQIDALATGASFALSIEGMNDMTKPDDYFAIKAVCLGDFKTYSTITTPGLYMIPLDGILRVRMKAVSGVGTFKAYGVAIG